MTTEIYIENQPVDISASLSNLITFAIDDVKDFATRQTAYSKTVVLPGTARNNKLFGYIFETGSSNDYDPDGNNIGYNFNASKSARCLMFQDNLQTFKGTVRMLQINKDRGNIDYEVALNGELTSLNVSLSGGLLEDLDFSEYDGFYSTSAIAASWDNNGSGLYYPLIDYGTYSLLKHDWDIHTFRPALFVKEYIDKMFAAANFRYSSALFETTRFKGLIIPHNRKVLTRRDTDVLEATITGTHSEPSIFDWDAIASSIFILSAGDTHIEYTDTPSITGTLRASVSGFFRNQDLQIIFYKNGVPIMSRTILWNGSIPQFFSYTQDLPGVSLATGDYFSCIVQTNNPTTGYAKSITKNTVEFFSDTPQDVEVDLNEPVSVNDTIPKNIRQVDFLTSIVKLFNLYIYEDKFDERLVYITPFPDFYSSDSANSIEWTYKLDREKPQKLVPMSEVNSKVYNFSYKDDNDYYNELYKKRYNEGYGSYVYDSQFEFASQVNKLELIFAGTPIVGYSGEEKIYSTIFKKNGTVEERIDSVIRILQTKKITGVTSWDILSTGLVIDSYTDYGYAGHFNDPDDPQDDLNFGVLEELFFALATGNLTNTQFNIYWSAYMAEITDKDSKMFSGRFYLTPQDIFNLDFSKYVVLDNVLFRLNKVIDYNSSIPDTCEVQLLKVINTLY